jgi:hypothetical protein
MDEKLEPNWWDNTKAWVSNNRVATGAIAGFAAGTIVPGPGNVIGAIVGAGIGYASTKEKEAQDK